MQGAKRGNLVLSEWMRTAAAALAFAYSPFLGAAGTPGGTVMVMDINPAPGGSSSPVQLTNVNGTLFFIATDGPLPVEYFNAQTEAEGRFPANGIQRILCVNVCDLDLDLNLIHFPDAIDNHGEFLNVRE